jgi:hypothetical protein
MRRSKIFYGWVVTGALAVSASACSPGSMVDRLPTEMGGLPATAPQRNAAPPPYPAVHDVPAARAAPLSDEQQLKLEKGLTAARTRQEAMQDKNVKARGDAATARANEAIEKARAAAQKKPPKPENQ